MINPRRLAGLDGLGDARIAAAAKQPRPVPRKRGCPHMACNTLIERVTGRAAEVPVPVAVEVVLTDESLLAGDTAPARVPGYGPVPAAVARRLVAAAAGDSRSRATLRRLYKHPRSGALVLMESRARLFPAGLARSIDLRDDTCRTPFCDAPIVTVDLSGIEIHIGKQIAQHAA